MLTDRNTTKPRGFAFIEYEHERDMHSAYKHADGKKIDGRRVLVDVERGRTVKGWRPRRLGGGLGGTRKGGPEENTRFSGREGSGREDRRSRSRERPQERDRGDRGEREVRRRRSRSREDRRVGRGERDNRRRSRSRDRRRMEEPEEDDERKDRKRGRRSKSRDRSRRSRSRDRKRRRTRSRERRRSRDRRIKEEPDDGFNPVKIKEEKTADDYRYGKLHNQEEEVEDRKNFDPALVKNEQDENEEDENGNEEEGDDYEEEEYYRGNPDQVKEEKIENY